jgi:hypothetical protein
VGNHRGVFFSFVNDVKKQRFAVKKQQKKVAKNDQNN